MRRSLLLAAVGALAAAAAGSSVAGAAERPLALLQALDKVVARTSTLEAPLDVPIRFGTLSIVVRVCHEAPPEEPPETAAFLEIDEVDHEGRATRRYTGWMFSSTPGLAALEHPVYDIGVLACTESPPASETASSENPAG